MAISAGGTPILVTGAAGFIGFHVAYRLLEEGCKVLGLDNFNHYYDPALKEARAAKLLSFPGFHLERLDLADCAGVTALFEANRFAHVVHLAAQVGVRSSLSNPHAYVDSNVVGFLNILEGCRRAGCRHLVYASSSSVYGANTKVPFSTSDNVDHPLSLYAATKKADELMAHSYAHLYGLPVSGLRFFTVYGPWGRPEMAVWLFTEAILQGNPVRLFNHGRMRRDFTYIDDVVEAVVRLLEHPPRGNPSWSGKHPDPATSLAPWRIYNIGNNRPIEITRLVEILEEVTSRPAKCEFVPLQPGDVIETCADSAALEEAVGYKPGTPIEEGIKRFVDWYRGYRTASSPASVRFR
jgi:UDP-glucuronate 4-epimerase